MVDLARDFLVPLISENMTMMRVFKTLKKLFEHISINVTLTLRKQLSNMKMMKSENISSYFMRIVELWDKLKYSYDHLKCSPTVLGVFHPNYKWLNQVAQI